MTPLCFTLFDATLQWTLDNEINSFMVIFEGEAFQQYPELEKHIQPAPGGRRILTMNLHPDALVGKLVYRADTTLEFAQKILGVVYQFKMKLTDIIGVALPMHENPLERTIVAFPRQYNVNEGDLAEDAEVVIGNTTNPTVIEASKDKHWLGGQHPDLEMDKRLSYVPVEDFPNHPRFEYYILTNKPHATLVGRSAEDLKPRLFVVKAPQEVEPKAPVTPIKAVTDYSRYSEYQTAKEHGYSGPYNVWYKEKTEAEAKLAEAAKGPEPLLNWDVLAKEEPKLQPKGVLPVTNLAEYRQRKKDRE